MNEISNELSSINAEIVELERSRANINVEYIKKYSFENIENLSKLNSYVRQWNKDRRYFLDCTKI